MYRFFRPLLFRLDPETAHSLTLNLVRLAGVIPAARWLLQALFAAPDKPVRVFGLQFKNPVGLAAGYDKDGIAIPGLSALGFGHLEIGTVTPLPQPGNPRPRIFRLVEQAAVINRMGFPSRGAGIVGASLRAALKKQTGDLSGEVQGSSSGRAPMPHTRTIIGVNLGKNKATPLEEAAGDYLTLLRRFMPLADYLTINISSPNTEGLRRLQGRTMLEGLLGSIKEERAAITLEGGKNKPILVKLSPDLGGDELDDALDVLLRTGMDGVIAANTTLARPELGVPGMSETGGLSGGPLALRAGQMLARLVKLLDGRLPVVSVGGILSPEDARRRLEMGAALVQVYTGLVYAGPGLVRKILLEI